MIKATGSCSFIPNPDEDCGNLGETLLYSIGFAIPSGLILLSYVAIFLKVKSRLIWKITSVPVFKIRKMDFATISVEVRKSERVCIVKYTLLRKKILVQVQV